MADHDTASSRAQATWEAFTAQAPRLARRVEGRFAAHRHHVIATVRASGAPRVSGTEVEIGPAGVGLGMMGGSRKLADVRRDPRVEIHSAPLEEDLAQGDAKLAGRLVEREVEDEEHAGAGFFGLVLERVSLVRVENDELALELWDPRRGVREIRRQ